LSGGADLKALNVELLDKRSVYRTPVIVLAMCIVIIAIEVLVIKANIAILAGAFAYVLRWAVPMLAAYFLSGCRCGDGPFFMTTGGFLGAVGALIGAGLGLLFQGMIIANVPVDDGLVAYVVSMIPYLVFATLGSFSATYRWHARDLEIVWGDEYGSEVGKTSVEKFMARAGPPPQPPKTRSGKRTPKKKSKG
jgi:hypothetical protein